jgi:hypothetical protein
MVASSRRTKAGGEGPPRGLPEGNPVYPEPTHDFTLQAVMEMQKTLGGLCANVDSLRINVDKLSDKIDANSAEVTSISKKIQWWSGAGWAVAGLIAILWAILTQIPWDRLAGYSDDRSSSTQSETASPPGGRR